MARSTRIQPIPASGLFNSVAERRVPLSRAWRMENCTCEKDRFEVAPRHGGSWSTYAGANSLHYGAFVGSQEFIVIADGKAYRGTTAGVFTQISVGDSDILHDSTWYSAQYRGWFYFINPNSSTMYKRKIGATGTVDENWMRWSPTLKEPDVTYTSSAKIITPPYNDLDFKTSGGTLTLTRITGATMTQPGETLVFNNVKGATTVRGIATTNAAHDLSNIDTIRMTLNLDSADFDGTPPVIDFTNTYFAISEDSATAATQAFIDTLTKLRYWMWEVPKASSDSHDYHLVIDLSTLPNASKNAIRRWVLSLALTSVGIEQTYRATFEIDFAGAGMMWENYWGDDEDYSTTAVHQPPLTYEPKDTLGVEYAYAFYDPLASPTIYHNAERLNLAPGLIQGEFRPLENILPLTPTVPRPSMGAAVRLLGDADSAYYTDGYTKVAFLRRRPDAGKFPLNSSWPANSQFDGQWVRLDDGTCPNAEDSGTAQAGAGSTITLRAAASAVDDMYTGAYITTTGGTGSGQVRKISDYVGATKVATVSVAWTTNPDATTTYSITPGWEDQESWSQLSIAKSTAVDGAYLWFSTAAFGTSAEAIAVWKNHLVLAADRKLWFSFEGDTNLFMPDPESSLPAFIPDVGDFTAGRTVYLSDDRVDSCRGMASRDVFYAASQRDVFSMAGDNAMLATRPRRLYNSRGAISRSGTIAWKDGIVVAAYDGLWYFQDTRPGTAVDPVAKELTENVRDDWKRIIGAESDWDTLFLVEWEDELWVFNTTTVGEDLEVLATAEPRYMKLSRPQPGQQGARRIETGATPQQVMGAVAVQGVGMRVLFADGELVRFVRDDVGSIYTTDDGVDVTWSYETGREPWPLSSQVIGIKAYATGSPTITVTVFRGSSDAGAPFLVPHVDGQLWESDINILPGHEIQVTIAGGSADAVDSLFFVVEGDEFGFGQ